MRTAAAAHVAGDALADVLPAPAGGFGRPFGVGDEGPHEAHRVGGAVRQELLALLGRDEARHGEGGHAGRGPAHLGCVVSEGRPGEAHVGDHPVDGGVVGLADAHVVHAGTGHEVRHNLAALAGGQPAGGEFLGADTDSHRQAVSDLGPHRLEHLQRQPAAVLQRAAIAVGATVAEPRQELAQQVAVGQVHLQPVEAGGDEAPGGAAVAIGQLGDVAARHGVRHDPAGGVGHRRRRPEFPVGGERVALAAQVRELAEDGGTFRLHHLSHAGVGRDAVVAVDLVHAGRRQAGGMHHGGSLDDESDSAGGPLGEVVALPLGQVVGVPVHEARAVAGEDHPVADLQRADPQRAEEQREVTAPPAGVGPARTPGAPASGPWAHPGGPAAAGRPRRRACRSPRPGRWPGRWPPR